MIGHLRGIATISGLQVFAESILPVLTRELGPDGFEVHVVGGYDPPRRGARRASTTLRSCVAARSSHPTTSSSPPTSCSCRRR